MTLTIKSTKDTSLISQNSITKGYRKDWNLNRFGGDYGSGKNFFYIHWEVNSDSPSIIRFHIESPKFEIDQKLNDIKALMIEDIKNILPEITNIIKDDFIKDSSRTNKVSNIKNNKSSEVFQIILEKEIQFKEVKQKLIEIDKLIGNILDKEVSKYLPTLKKLNMSLKD
jgi:hypothetical protein